MIYIKTKMKEAIIENAHWPCTYCAGHDFGDEDQCYCSSLSTEQNNTGQFPIETYTSFDGI